MKLNHYTIGALPDLHWDVEPEKRLKDFLIDSQVMFHGYEEELKDLYLFNDIKNIELLLKMKMDYKGEKLSEFQVIDYFVPYVVDQKFLEKFIDRPFVWQPDDFPIFMVDYFEKYTELESRYNHIEELYVDYFQFLENHSISFFRYYGRIFGTLFTVLSAYRLIRSGKDLEKNLKGDPIIVQTILENRSTSDLGLKTVFWEIPEVVALFEKGLLDIEHGFDKLVFHLLEGVGQEAPFGDHVIFTYIIKYFILDRWSSMNEEKGNEILDNIISG